MADDTPKPPPDDTQSTPGIFDAMGEAAEKAKNSLVGHTLKDITETITGVGPLDFTVSGINSLLAQAGRGFANVALEATGQGEAAEQEPDTGAVYQPHTEVGQFLSKAFGKVMQGVHKTFEPVAEEAFKQYEPYSPHAAAAVAALVQATGDVSPMLLFKDTPLSDAAELATRPVRSVLKQGYVAAQEKIHGGGWGVATEVQRSAEKHIAQVTSVYHELGRQVQDSEGKFSPADLEAVREYSEVEGKTPADFAKLTPTQQALYSGYILPLRRQLGISDESGYFPRYSLAHKSSLAAFVRGREPPSLTPKLSTEVTASNERLYYEDAFDNRGVVRVERMPGNQAVVTRWADGRKIPHQDGLYEDVIKLPEGIRLGEDYLGNKGKDFLGKIRNKFTLKETTVNKIEQHTPLKYVHDPRTAYMEAVKQKTLKDATEAWRDALNQELEGRGFAKPRDPEMFSEPEGFTGVNSPFLRGHVYHPTVARVLDSMFSRGNSYEKWMGGLNSATIAASFMLSPLWHPSNIAAMWVVDKFPRLASEYAWRDMPKNYAKAWQQVSSYGDDYLMLYRNGFGLMKLRTGAATDYRDVMQGLADELDTPRVKQLFGKDQTLWEDAKAGLNMVLGPFMRPAKGLSDFSHWAAWQANDTFFMQSIYDRMAENPKLDLLDAARDAQQSFPQYRMPYTSAVLGLAHRSQLFFFLPYHLDRMRVVWNQAAGTVTGDREKAAMFAGSLVLSQVVWPEMNKQLQEATHNQRAYVEPYGTLRLIQDIVNTAGPDKERSLWSLTKTMVTPSLPAQLTFGSVETLRPKHGKWPGLAAQGENIAENIAELANYPLADLLRSQQRDPEAVVLTQLGVFQPKAPKTRAPKGLPQMPRVKLPPAQ